MTEKFRHLERLLNVSQMQIVSVARPPNLYRYSDYRWNLKSLIEGEFRLAPASSYLNLEDDQARQDNEIVREETVPGHMVKVTHLATGKPIKVVGDLTYRDDLGTDYYTLCMSSAWDPLLFEEFIGSNSCLVIHEPNEVCERIHFYAERELKNWFGIDAGVSYLQKHRLGPAFTKPWKYLAQKEWRFAWHPQTQHTKLEPIFIRIGSIERFAEIIGKPSGTGGVNG